MLPAAKPLATNLSPQRKGRKLKNAMQPVGCRLDFFLLKSAKLSQGLAGVTIPYL